MDKRLSLTRLMYPGARVILGMVFLYASIDKIAQPAAFAETVANYRMLPHGLVNATAILLPWLELVLGVLLLSGVWLPGAVVMGNGLLWVFFGAVAYNLIRGLDMGCGCFSASGAGDATTLYTLLRDALFLIPAGYLFHATFIGKPRPVDGIV